MKQLLEQIGTNRQVFQKKVELEFARPFGSLLRAKAMWEEEEGLGEGKKEGLSPVFEESPVLSAFLNEVRTFFERESARS